MYETETQAKKRKALEKATMLHNLQIEGFNVMYSVYEAFIAQGMKQSRAITETSKETGLPRSTVVYRIIQRYGNVKGNVIQPE